MKELIIATVEPMINNWFFYGNGTYYVKEYRLNDEKEQFTLITDHKNFSRPYENVTEFLNQFEALPDKPAVQISNPKGLYLPEVTVNQTVIKELKDVLMDNIRKVKEDKGYIAQAESIKSNVDAIIDLAKTEISYLHAIDRLNH